MERKGKISHRDHNVVLPPDPVVAVVAAAEPAVAAVVGGLDEPIRANPRARSKPPPPKASLSSSSSSAATPPEVCRFCCCCCPSPGPPALPLVMLIPLTLLSSPGGPPATPKLALLMLSPLVLTLVGLPPPSMGGGLELMIPRVLSPSASLLPFSPRLRSILSGLRSGTLTPGVTPPKAPFQNKPAGPAGLDSGINLEGATKVLGGARRGFCRKGAGVRMLLVMGPPGPEE